MPIREAYRSKRDRWPLQFDLEGVPDDNLEREAELRRMRILEGDQPNMAPKNQFAVDYQQGNGIMDINNPPRKPYNPHAPENQYPKMLYSDAGKTVIAQNEAEEKQLGKKGFGPKPPVKKAEEVSA